MADVPGATQPASVSTTLRALLEKNGVDESVIAFLGESGCKELSSFSNWVEQKAELKQAVIDKTPKKDDPGELAKLKQAWREAEALNSRSLKRAAEGLQGEELDSPLDSDVQKQVEDNFRKAYGWPGLPSRQVACDSLLGRVKREFERRQPSMFSILRVRTLAQAQRGNPLKTRRLSESVSLQLGEGEDDTPASTNGLYAWLLLLQVLCTTWAVAGCFYTEAGSGKRDRFAHWAQTCEYYSEIAYRAHEALLLFTEESVVGWIQMVEEEMRARAIELVRGVQKELWGNALLQALKDCSHRWAETRTSLNPRAKAVRPQLPVNPQTPVPPGTPTPPGRPQPLPPPGGPAPSPKKWKTGSTLMNGASVCKRWNDPRGCAKACPNGKAHVCDIVLASSGRICGRKDHPRTKHEPAKHGMPATI